MLRPMASPKVKMINVRLKPDTHDEFKIACELRGGSMSSLMHQFIVRTIREEKERDPRAFLPKENNVHLATNSRHSLKTPKKTDGRRRKQGG